MLRVEEDDNEEGDGGMFVIVDKLIELKNQPTKQTLEMKESRERKASYWVLVLIF